MDIPLFIKSICGYVSNILCKNIFALLCLTLTWNLLCFKNATKRFMENLKGTKNRYIFVTEINAYNNNLLFPIMSYYRRFCRLYT